MSQYKITPLFISSTRGSLFAMYYTPIISNGSQCIIHIPAFAEEMNKSRHMVAMQAQAWAEQGYAVLVLDLWGTGDSQGDFSEATWDIWLNDIDTAVKWLQEKEYISINLWGLRSGVLLALDYLQKHGLNIDKFICWQPVLNGELFIMQFLRLRIAAAMMNKNKTQEKTSELKQQLLNGQSVEVAGYFLNPELVIPMISVQAKSININSVKQINIFELVQGNEVVESHVTNQWIKKLTGNKNKVSLDVIIDNSYFWLTQEITESIDLIKLSSERV